MVLTDGDLQKIGSLFQPRFAALEATMATNADVQQSKSELLGAIAHLAQALADSAQRSVHQDAYARLQQRVEELEELIQSLGPPAV